MVYSNVRLQSARGKLLFWLSAFIYVLFLLWLYWPGLYTFFANDDWVILGHIQSIPVSKPWQYFSMKTIWFYRPLQTMQYGITWYFAGINPFPYNIQLLIMHIISCALAWVFIRNLFTAAHATIAVLLFSVSSYSPDMLLWKANFNTLQNVIVTLATCITFLRFLDTERTRWFIGTCALLILNFFTKESAVNTPLVLFAVWVARVTQCKWSSGNPVNNHLLTIKGIGGYFLITGVLVTLFVATHFHYFKNVENRSRLEYDFVGIGQGIIQLNSAICRSFLGLIYVPLFSILPVRVAEVLGRIFLLNYAGAYLILALTLWKRSSILLFCWLFIMALQFPSFMLLTYVAGRYYYLPIIAGALVLAHVVLSLYNHFQANPRHNYVRTSALLAGVLLLVSIYLGNVIYYQARIAEATARSETLISFYSWLDRYSRGVPENSVIVVYNPPEGAFVGSVGATEMFQFATGQKQVRVFTEDTLFKQPELRDFIFKFDHRFSLDFNRQPWQFQTIIRD